MTVLTPENRQWINKVFHPIAVDARHRGMTREAAKYEIKKHLKEHEPVVYSWVETHSNFMRAARNESNSAAGFETGYAAKMDDGVQRGLEVIAEMRKVLDDVYGRKEYATGKKRAPRGKVVKAESPSEADARAERWYRNCIAKTGAVPTPAMLALLTDRPYPFWEALNMRLFKEGFIFDDLGIVPPIGARVTQPPSTEEKLVQLRKQVVSIMQEIDDLLK